MEAQTLYDILGIRIDASFKEVRKAYLKKVVSEHPDKGGTASSFEKVQHAYKTLSNPEERIVYDETVLGQRIAEEEGEEEFRYPPTYHTAGGVTVEFHGQQRSSRREFQRKGGSYAGQGGDEILADLNRQIEDRQRHHLENPTESALDLAMAYIERAVYHLNHGKEIHALFDANEAEHLHPDIFIHNVCNDFLIRVKSFLDDRPDDESCCLFPESDDEDDSADEDL